MASCFSSTQLEGLEFDNLSLDDARTENETYAIVLSKEKNSKKTT